MYAFSLIISKSSIILGKLIKQRKNVRPELQRISVFTSVLIIYRLAMRKVITTKYVTSENASKIKIMIMIEHYIVIETTLIQWRMGTPSVSRSLNASTCLENSCLAHQRIKQSIISEIASTTTMDRCL